MKFSSDSHNTTPLHSLFKLRKRANPPGESRKIGRLADRLDPPRYQELLDWGSSTDQDVVPVQDHCWANMMGLFFLRITRNLAKAFFT